MRCFRRLLLPGGLWWVAALACALGARGAESASKEYQIKAVFLYNLAQYVTWPDSAFPASDAPFAIGVLGDNPFGSALEDTVRGEKAALRPLVVRYGRRLDSLKSCQIIFIASSERKRLPEILAKIGDRPVLTVADTPGFADEGGAVEFYVDGKRVRFAVNVAAAHDRGLRPSAQLLSLAKVVGAAPGG